MADTLVELKNKKEERADQVRRYVDEYAALALEADRIKQRMDWLKGQFETMATVALKDTKLLSISYWGSQNSRVTVTNTATVKPISLTMVKKVLGEVAGDFVKSETVDKMTEPCKRLLAMVCQGNFTMGSLEETIRAITGDAKIQATLRKKLKGRYEKDKALLEKFGDASVVSIVEKLPEQEASDWAFLAAEVINWEWLAQVLEAAGWEGTTQEAIDIIRAAVIVEEGMKVGVEAEQPEV